MVPWHTNFSSPSSKGPAASRATTAQCASSLQASNEPDQSSSEPDTDTTVVDFAKIRIEDRSSPLRCWGMAGGAHPASGTDI